MSLAATTCLRLICRPARRRRRRFSRLAQAGLRQYDIAPGREAEYQQRLLYEIEMINRTGFADYYLIVADFVGWAKRQGIPVGPGRGSGAGSLVAFVLDITEIDPIPYGLLFERFLNPERVSMPDLDIDFCVDGRDRVIEYVVEKYGRERVAQIVTFGQIGARSAVRDVGRVLGYPYSMCDRVARMIPASPKNNLGKGLGGSTGAGGRSGDRRRSRRVAGVVTQSRRTAAQYRHACGRGADCAKADCRVLPAVRCRRHQQHGESDGHG